MKTAIVAAIALSLAGCASGYKQFYKSLVTPEEVAAMRVTPPPAEPEVQHSRPLAPEVIEPSFTRMGYGAIGFSSFNGAAGQSERGAVALGKKIGADIVLILDPQYTGTQSGVVPITTPTTSTTYSSGTATAYGAGGSVTAYGSGRSTTYGTQTNYVPYSVDRMDYTAVYFVKQKYRIGLNTRDLTDAERRSNESNIGAAVRVVVDGTPAFRADILPEDVILEVNGKPVYGAKGFSESAQAIPPGQQIVELKIRRNGELLSKSITIE